MTRLQTRGLFFETGSYGNPAHPAKLMIRGLGSQLIDWPHTLIDGLEASGLFVVVFDNRDAGLSQKMTAPENQAYDMSDMAQDCLDILDALDIERAHVLGISMGGLITQVLLAQSADRFLTATIVMSSIYNASLQDCLGSDVLLDPPKPTGDVRALLDEALEADAFYEGPSFPIPYTKRAENVRQRYERSYCPDGQKRQLAAMKRSQFDPKKLANCEVPSLIIHGDHDVIFPAIQAKKIAQAIPNSKFQPISGMGHEISDDLGALIAGHVVNHFQASRVEDAHVATH
ncbi:MAG: alpha/beta hydrolase [Pseudomonadota bacterium]